MSGVTLVDGDCDDPGNTLKTWGFTNDGDGNKVMQVVAEGTSVLTTLYFEGGSYEVQTDGVNTVVKNYYTLAGMTVAMRVGTDWTFFLTDHLGLRSVHTRAAKRREVPWWPRPTPRVR